MPVMERSSSIQRTRLSTNFTTGPKLPPFDFNGQVEIGGRAAGPLSAATANVERDYLGRRACPVAEDLARKLLHDWDVLSCARSHNTLE